MSLKLAAGNGKTLGSIGSILGTITVAAERTSQLLNTAGSTIDQLDRFTQHASMKQKRRHKIEERQFTKRLILDAASADAEADIKVQEFRAKSEQHASLFDASFEEYTNLFAEELGITS